MANKLLVTKILVLPINSVVYRQNTALAIFFEIPDPTLEEKYQRKSRTFQIYVCMYI